VDETLVHTHRVLVLYVEPEKTLVGLAAAHQAGADQLNGPGKQLLVRVHKVDPPVSVAAPALVRVALELAMGLLVVLIVALPSRHVLFPLFPGLHETLASIQAVAILAAGSMGVMQQGVAVCEPLPAEVVLDLAELLLVRLGGVGAGAHVDVQPLGQVFLVHADSEPVLKPARNVSVFV